METTSYWIDTAPLPRFPALATELEVDVVVIGAGITGITAAYLLKRAGRRVALLERRTCARIDTGHTTAHVTAVTDLRLTEIARKLGRDAARAVWDAGAAAIDQIVTHIRQEDIACEFRWVTGYLHAPLDAGDAKQTEQLRTEASFARELAVDAEFVERIPFFGLPGIAFRQQALFHPRRYLSGLLQTIPGNGSHVFEETEVSEVHDDATAVVTTHGHRIRCRQLIVATHNPATGAAGLLGATLFQSKLALYSTYAIGARIPAGRVPVAAYWDTNDPYYYLRIERGAEQDYAIFGGEDHKTGQETDTTAAYRRLEERLRRWLPEAQVDHRWSGQVIETNDGLPFMGEFRPNQFAATGFAGNGMTFGTLGAVLIVDAILGRANPWRDLFDPGRKKLLAGAWSYLTENKDYPFFLLRDWLGGSEGRSLHALKPGEGRVLHLNGRKVAAYRSAEGRVTLCSPVCTHLKCIVRWNAAEHTWDCPCHGSRFKPDGSVISGPAETPLERLATPLE